MQVPLRRGDPNDLGERFELKIDIFNPDNSSPHKPYDHTHVRYYTESDEVFYIDLVYQLLWGTPSSEEPIIESYSADKIDQALEEKYSLFPFDAELAKKINLDLWYGSEVSSPTQLKDHDDMLNAMMTVRSLKNLKSHQTKR